MTRPLFAPRRSLLRQAVALRTQVVVMPLWGLYHGKGDDLVRELDALGEDSYMLMQSGPLFGDATVLEEGLPS
jgi:hypothetical protein